MELEGGEVLALNAILECAITRSREEDDGNPVLHEVPVDSVNPFADRRIQSAVFDSLAKKGLIECSGTEDISGDDGAEYVCITPQGLEALKFAKGMH